MKYIILFGRFSRSLKESTIKIIDGNTRFEAAKAIKITAI
jgi:hypothetical protein